MKVTSNTEYTPIHVDGTEASINAATEALITHGVEDVTPDALRTLLEGLTEDRWLLFGDDHTILSVHPTDFAANYSDVDEEVLAALEADAAPTLPEAMRQGEFTTTVHWQYEAIDTDDTGTPTGGTTWLPATDEADARAHARQHLRVIRHWSEIVVSGQKTEVRL